MGFLIRESVLWGVAEEVFVVRHFYNGYENLIEMPNYEVKMATAYFVPAMEENQP